MRSRAPLLALALLALASGASAQARIPGYSPAAAARQAELEADAIRRPDSASARAHAAALSREPHVSGTEAQARTRDYVIDRMRGWGLETEVRAYDVWMPHATSVRVWRLSPAPVELPLQEPAVPGDPTTALPHYPPANGYSGTGDVSGEVVFVNFGLIEDYARLDSMGVSVRGKVAVARYGRSFRGIKAREAERNGAIALLMYSDPQDDGYVRGDVYPEGPMRPGGGIQRGSVMNAVGDPSTPGYASTAGARRVPVDSMNVPRIPVVPISYENAAELLRDLRGAAIPQQGWQGGLPFRYHVGPGPVRARVVVASDSATSPYKTIWNTFGVVRGAELPDELVVIGAHRDAWGAGAVDNVSGTVSVLEAARAVAEQLRAGHRPRRTIVFATWDAEEWGLIGSTEHVEDDRERLLRGGVAYLNQDVTASGERFGGGGTPSLRPVLRDVTRRVPHPGGGGSIYEVWRAGAGVAAGAEPPMGDPGGGSDFAGFYNHLGIPHSDWGFGGPSGIYHSAYDTPAWMERFGPGYAFHAAAGRVGAAMALRLANAELLPYDYVEFARTMRRYLPALDSAIARRGWSGDAAGLRAAIERMENAAESLDRERESALAGGNLSPAAAAAANAALLRVERALTRPEGLRTRPWYRNLVYAADVDNGYSNIVFPSVNEAIRAGDESLTREEIADLAGRFEAATAALRDAAAALGSEGVGR